MYLRFFKNFFNYSIYSLAILLTFLLVFERFLDFPLLVSWLGHWHPLILHFPIVLIFVTVVQYWRKDEHAAIYLAITTISTLVSAITGFVLSLEGGSKGGLITTHQWIAVAVCLLLVLWFYFQHTISGVLVKLLQGALLVLIVLTGHFGGMVTHGKDFLALGEDSSGEVVSLPDDPNIYRHIVQPILERKCVSCHNENKAKGELVLTNYPAIISGGKSGSILDEEIGMLHRISLPMEDEDHMPPADEEQLDQDEITILEEWLDQEASAELMYSALAQGSALYSLTEQLIRESNANLWMDLPEVSEDKIAEITSEYCTVKRMYAGSNALQVILFPHQSFSSKEIEKLKPIAKSTVELNLSNLPLTEQDIEFLNNFENLEHLNLSGSTISDENFRELSKLKKLKTLKIYNTAVGDATLESLSAIPTLSMLYVYNTNISSGGIDDLKADSPTLKVVGQAPEALEFKSMLPPPVPEPEKYFFRDPFYLKLEHPLENINVKYTMDGSDPGDESSVMMDSFLVDESMAIKFYAAKEGWESSTMDSLRIFKSGPKPSSFELANDADKKYMGSGKSLLFDLEKGPANYGDDTWMGFKDERFSLTCEFEYDLSIGMVILSSVIDTNPYLFPPSSIKVYGGNHQDKLQQLGVQYPKALRERHERHFKYYEIELVDRPVRFLKIEVTPLQNIPAWHQGKGQKGWFFIDEVILTEN